MQIIKVNLETMEARKASINPKLDMKEFCDSREDYFLIDKIVDPTKSWIYDETTNTVNENIKGSKTMAFNRNKLRAKSLIDQTDRFMLIDNPNDFSDEEIAEIIAFRKELRKDQIEILPEIPDCLYEYVEV